MSVIGVSLRTYERAVRAHVDGMPDCVAIPTESRADKRMNSLLVHRT